jgi:hypothetical protein
MTITDDIKDAIKKNLSSEVSEVLQIELAKVGTLENELKFALTKFDNQKLLLDAAQEKLKKLTEYEQREKELQEREAAVKEEKYNIELTVAANQIANFKTNYNQLLELTRVIFRSPITKQTVFEQGGTTGSDNIYRNINKNATFYYNPDTSDNTCT